MEIKGAVYKIQEMMKGQGARGEWQRQEIVISLPGDFPRYVAVEFWNERATRAAALNEGDQIAVDYRIESREYQGRWYTRVTGLSINQAGAAQHPTQSQNSGQTYPVYANSPAAAQAATPDAPSIENNAAGADDLPF